MQLIQVQERCSFIQKNKNKNKHKNKNKNKNYFIAYNIIYNETTIT